ncbi:MAG: GNAT family N-acetyltransferase, partial [Mycobacteriales bacterium]
MPSPAVRQSSVLTGDDAIRGLTEIEALLEETGAPITARVPWLRAWAGATQDLPVLVIAHSGAGPTAAAPLAVRRRGPVMEVLAWGHQDSDQVSLPARTPADAGELARALHAYLRGLRRPWTLRVEQLPVADGAGRALARTLPRAALSEGDVSPRTVFGQERTLAQHLSRNGRRSALQASNRLSAASLDPQIGYWRSPDDVGRHLVDLEGLRRRRDHALGRPSAMDDPARRAFYRTVVLGAAAAGELELATLHVDGRLAAYDVCFIDRGWLRLWDGRIEPDLAHYGVGKL